VYLLHPVLIEVYASVPWTQNENFVPTELLIVAVFVLVLLVCCVLTRQFIEAPMQRLGRGAAGRLDARFGPDVLRSRRRRIRRRGGAKPPLAANDPKTVAAVNDPASISMDDSGPSFPSVNALITAFDRATGGTSPASQETRAAERGDKLPSPLYTGSVTATCHAVFTTVTYVRSWRLIMRFTNSFIVPRANEYLPLAVTP